MPGNVIGLESEVSVVSAPARRKKPCVFVSAGLGVAAMVDLLLIGSTLADWMQQGGLAGAVGNGLVFRLALLVAGLCVLLYVRQRVVRACVADET